jgi:hypothetical protein
MRAFKFVVTGLGLLAAPVSTVAGADMVFALRLQVPVYCVVQQRASGAAVATGAAVSLGQFREYCNAPGGYQMVVRYEPGKLRGAVLAAGDDQVVLDGSGQAILSRASGPRVRERSILATPGAAGFDTDRLEFQLIPA